MASSAPDSSLVATHLPVSEPVNHTPPKSPAQQATAAQPQSPKDPHLASLATASLSAPLQAKSVKRGMPAEFDAPSLTGSLAIEDERRERLEQERRNATKTSPNLAMSTLSTLKGGVEANTSKPSDGPPPVHTGAPPPIITQTSPVAEPTQMQTSPVSMSSAESSNKVRISNTGPLNHATVESPTSLEAPNNSLRPENGEHSSKAMTYPPSRSSEHLDDHRDHARNMSLPGGSFGSPRSPSNKKHKCPYCDTEFTRHHNLKSHLLTHSQEKPYVCQTCHARFRRLHDLKRHTKLHTGERPHICPKCGRKFARGDALARHNKGQGGCAGRRSSLGGDGDYDDDGSGGEEMDGVVYNNQDGSEGDMHDAEPGRRKSEPNRKAIRAAMDSRRDSSNVTPRQSTTYPGSAVMKATQGMYPPTTHRLSNAGTSPRSGVQHLSPRPAGTSASSHMSGGNGSTYSQSIMTESPRPLSPGQPDPHRMSLDHSNYHRPRSPHQQYSRSGYGTPPHVLPPMTGAQQLPSLSTLAQDNRQVLPSQNSPSTNKTGSYPSVVTHTSGSGSHHSSASSMREVMSGNDMWDYIRNLEERMKAQENHYEARISDLQNELNTLKRDQMVPNSQPAQQLPPTSR